MIHWLFFVLHNGFQITDVWSRFACNYVYDENCLQSLGWTEKVILLSIYKTNTYFW